jgi:hypothetical protein
MLGLCLLAPAAYQAGVSASVAHEAQPSTLSFWGINAYLTKNERVGRDNVDLLATKTIDAGARWTREEFPWAYIDDNPGRRGRYRTEYDSRIRQVAARGLGIIGMLLTTPAWAYDPTCEARDYWCPPAGEHVQDYANFAAWMVERYDGDGHADAPGSPRVAYWEIWNEPNDTALWHEIGTPRVTRKQRYGELLVAAYTAIKNADPTARVLIGGVYIFDGHFANDVLEDGLYFLNARNGVFQQVPAARDAYDIFSLHPYVPTTRPEAPEAHQSITVEGRIRLARNWLRDAGGGNRRDDPPIWITEMGWCTEKTEACGPQPGLTEDQQANYLVRSMVIAQQTGVEHVDWFQLEDAFNTPRTAFNSMAILKDLSGGDYAAKQAYTAYSTLARLLEGARPSGTGPVNTHVYAAGADRGNPDDVYDYRYIDGTTTIDVIWRVTGSSTVSFPVQSGKKVVRVNRNGVATTLEPQGGRVSLAIGETPQYLVQAEVSALMAAPSEITILAETGTLSVTRALSIENSGFGPLDWRLLARDSWITLDRSSGTTPDTIHLTVSTGGRPAGAFEGGIMLRADGVTDLIVPVRVVIADTLHSVYLPLARR